MNWEAKHVLGIIEDTYNVKSFRQSEFLRFVSLDVPSPLDVKCTKVDGEIGNRTNHGTKGEYNSMTE